MNKTRLQVLRLGWILGFAALFWALAIPRAMYAADESQIVAAETPAVDNPEDVGEVAVVPESGVDWDETADDNEASLMAEGMEESYFSVMAKLGLGLGLVVLLAWGAVYLLRKTAVGQQFGTGGMIRVAERAYLGPKKFVCLVEIGDKVLALGVTEEHISTLTQWDEGELELPSDPAIPGAFASQFKSLLGQEKSGPRRRNDEGGEV